MTRRAKITFTIIAAVLILIAVVLSLPIYGRVTPTARYTVALSHAKQLRALLSKPSESDLDRSPKNLPSFLKDPAYFNLLSITDPFPPHHVIHFMDVHDATAGTILFAASNSIKNPKTGQWVRLIIHATTESPTIPETEFQSLLHQHLIPK